MRIRHNFTIMELLLVMSIAGILLAITLPAFSHISQGKRTTGATTIITSKINLARSYAVTNRCYTAVVFPMNGTGSTVPVSMNRTSLRACVVYNDNGTYTFAKWLPEDSWEILPDGVIIDSFTLTPVTAVSGAKIEAAYAGSDITSIGSCSIIFKPNGRLANTAEPRITLIEAVAHPVEAGKFIEKQAANNKVQQTILSFNLYTGKGETTYSERETSNK